MRGCVSCSRCVCPCSTLVCACAAAAGVLDKTSRGLCRGNYLCIGDGYRSVFSCVVVSSSRLHEQMCRTTRHVFN